ncbi:mevalonate kinase [Brachybacterium alimentarium]|uniref:mevalonate kinase n=1 Tax=Brachybacterium alimentarium TaxID=47845 RepID=UPI003FD3C413
MRTSPAPQRDPSRRAASAATVREGVGSAHAKAILLGEHSAVFGAPAIVLPVHELTARARLTIPDPAGEPDGSTLRCALYDGPVRSAPEGTAPVVLGWQYAAERVGLQDAGGRLSITSDIPIRRGLGSSAAVSAALVDAVADAAGRDLALDDRMQLIADAEAVAHGRASGIDAAAVLAQAPIRVERGTPTTLPLGSGQMHFVIADTGVAGMTATAVGGVQELHRTRPAYVDTLVGRLAALTDEAAAALAADDVAALGGAMDDAHSALQSLGVSSERLDHLVEAARGAGAAGAKMTGGGLGGCLIVLSATADTTDLERTLAEAGATGTWTTSCGGQSWPRLQHEPTPTSHS